MKIRLGTRGSELARTQSGHVAEALRAHGHEVDLVTIRTEGDVTLGSLTDSGGTGVFAAALRRALLDGRIDIAVHSFKDLPTQTVPGLVIGAVPERESPFDVLCAKDGLTLAELPVAARVGTGSPRRAAQLRARRPDLVMVEIRGNVGTRLARVHGDGVNPGDLDAVVLARAGLTRLGRFDAVTDLLDILPAPAQGALAVERRLDDADVREALATINHPESHFCVMAERAILAALKAGCAAPIGAHVQVVNGVAELRATVVSVDGSAAVHARRSVPMPTDPVALGSAAAQHLLAEGAAAISPLGASRPSQLADFHDDHALWAPGTRVGLVGRRILLPRAEGALSAAVRAAGAEVDSVPLTRTVPRVPAPLPSGSDWVVFTSPTAVRALTEAGVPLTGLGRKVAVIGTATQRAAQEAGLRVDFVPCVPGQGVASDAETLVELFPPGSGRVLVPGSELARPTLAEGLRAKGWTVDIVASYTTASVDAAPDWLTEAWRQGGYDAVVLTAGSNARAVHDLLGLPPAGTRVVAFGRPSARAAAELGFVVDAVATTQDGAGVTAALLEALTRVKEN